MILFSLSRVSSLYIYVRIYVYQFFIQNSYVFLSSAAPSMIAGVMIDLPDVDTVIVDNNNTNVSFTLNWVEPFANFDPIVNYTVTINCSDASCPVMLSTNNVTTTANVSFTTNLSMMTPLSVSASNTIGTSDPTTIMIAGMLIHKF